MINTEKAFRLKTLRENLGLKQSEFAARIGTDQASIAKHENSKRPFGKNIEYKVLREFNVNEAWWETGHGDMFKTSGNAKISNELYEELEYIPVKARAGFAELQQLAPLPFETYRVIRTEIGDSFTKQVVIEIDGDSMEPNYTSGTKVRCKEIDPGDWVYINSGVYVIVYSNLFVVKRVKNSPSNGILTLHSDNTETGGTADVPLSDVRKIWKVMRIVDAPAR